MNPAGVAAALGGGMLAILTVAAGPALLTGTAMACTAPPTAAPTSPGAARASIRTPMHSQETGLPAVAGYDADQVANAAVIVQVGAGLGVPVRGWIIAVAVAIQETRLRNLDHGDVAGPDSRGLFQQRAAWGSVAERMNPAGAATLFYLGGHHGQPGLLDIAGWQMMPLTNVAQAVQRSATPTAYAARQEDATALVFAVSDAGRGMAAWCVGIPGPAAAQAVAFARAQLGLPYQWAGDGPARGDAGFDCSGLTHAAYAAAGVAIPRTARTQYGAGPHLPAGARLLPGDLLFFGSPGHVSHVGIYVGGNLMIDAPHRGAVVRVEDYRWVDYVGATRPAEGPSTPVHALPVPNR